MPKLWIGKKMYSVEAEVRDYCEKIETENAKLNIILYHRENALSHPDFKAEIEISKQAEQIEELGDGIERMNNKWVKIRRNLEKRIQELEDDKENLRQYASGLENAQNLITVRYKDLEDELTRTRKLLNAKV